VALAVPRNDDDAPAYHISVMSCKHCPTATGRSMEMVTAGAGSSLTPPSGHQSRAAVQCMPGHHIRSYRDGLLVVFIRND